MATTSRSAVRHYETSVVEKASFNKFRAISIEFAVIMGSSQPVGFVTTVLSTRMSTKRALSRKISDMNWPKLLSLRLCVGPSQWETEFRTQGMYR